MLYRYIVCQKNAIGYLYIYWYIYIYLIIYMGWKVDQNFRTPWSVKNSLPVQVWSRANWRKAQNQKTAVSNIPKNSWVGFRWGRNAGRTLYLKLLRVKIKGFRANGPRYEASRECPAGGPRLVLQTPWLSHCGGDKGNLVSPAMNWWGWRCLVGGKHFEISCYML